MKKPPDLAAQLLRKASNDMAAARIGLEHGAPLDTVCFHIQQAAEKLLKALAARNIAYPYTHELRELTELALSEYAVLAEFRETIPEYTEFAVRLRYDDIPWITEAETRAALAEVERLRQSLLPRIGL